MKRLLSLLFVAIAATSFAFAEETRIYCQMPYDWWWAGDGQGNTAAISLYAYGNNGNNAEFPGVKMNPLNESKRIWYIDVDLDGYSTIIFARSSQDNGNWGAQTGDLPVNEIGENNLYVITSEEGTWYGNEEPHHYCTGYWTKTQPVVTLRGLNGWGDGEVFTESEDHKTAVKDWYFSEAGDYGFKITVDTDWRANETAISRNDRTRDFSADVENAHATLQVDVPGVYYFIYNYETKVLTVAYPQTVYFVNSRGWESAQVQAYLYHYEENVVNENYKGWPGEAMTATEQTAFGHPVYSYTFPNNYPSIVFNNKHGEENAEGEQLPDAVWNADKPYYYEGEWYSAEDIANTFFITGTASLVGENEWKENAVKVTEGSYTFTNLAGGQYYELKVVYNGEWLGFDAVENAPAGVRTTGGEYGNIAFYLAQAGDVTVAFDKSTGKISLTGNFAHMSLDEASDNTAAITALDGIYVPVALNRSFAAGQLYTLCLPFDVNAADVETVLHAGKLYRLQSADNSGAEIAIYFDLVDACEAGVPYLYQPDEDVANPAFFATVKADEPATVEAGVVSMTGFYKPTATENYFLGDDTYLHKSTATAKAFRAYFAISAGAAHMPARVVMRGSGEQGTTELEKVQRDQEPSTKVIRNGQLVIIRDGKTFNALGAEMK